MFLAIFNRCYFSYKECVEIAKLEKENNARPAIKGDIPIEDYDVIFI